MNLTVILGAMCVGIAIGYLSAMVRSDAPKVDRYVQLDQRHYERWQAYCRLLGSPALIQAGRSWRMIDNAASAGAEPHVVVAATAAIADVVENVEPPPPPCLAATGPSPAESPSLDQDVTRDHKIAWVRGVTERRMG